MVFVYLLVDEKLDNHQVVDYRLEDGRLKEKDVTVQSDVLKAVKPKCELANYDTRMVDMQENDMKECGTERNMKESGKERNMTETDVKVTNVKVTNMKVYGMDDLKIMKKCH